VTAFGSGRPIVVVHGWRLSSTVERHDLEPVLSASPGWARIYLDLPGMGGVPHDPTLRTLADYAVAVHALVADRVAGPFAIAGSSAGAMIARAVAQRSGDQCRGMMLRVPLTTGDDAARDVDPDPDISAEQAAAAEAKKAAVIRPARAAADEVALAPLRADPARYDARVPDDERVDRPVLVLAGRQDRRVGYRDPFRLVDRYPRATFAVLDGAGHEMPAAPSAVFDALIRDWLDRVERTWDA